MATEEIITRYIAEVDGYLKEIEKLKAEIRTIITEEKKQTEESKKQTVTLKQAASERNKLLESEVATLKRLKAESKLAYSLVEIKKYNTSIAATQRNIDLLKNKTSELTGVQSLLKGAISGIGVGIAAAFSVGAIKSFADGAIQAFREAEVNAKKLQFAIEKIGGEAPKAFEELIRQSEELQNITIFSDDDVQRTQTQLSQFGLVSDEIKKLTPLITELAAASGKSLSEATDLVIQGINGQTRALKPLGLEFKNTGDKAENFAIITEKLNKFVGSNADLLETDAGKAANLANTFDDLKEKIGGLIANSDIFKGFTSSINDFIRSFKSLDELRAEQNRQNIEDAKNLINVGIQPQIDAQKKLLGVEITTAAKIKELNDGILQQEKDLKEAKDQRRKDLSAGLKTDEELNQQTKLFKLQQAKINQDKEELELEKQKKIVTDTKVKKVNGQQVITPEIESQLRLNELKKEQIRIEKLLENKTIGSERIKELKQEAIAVQELIRVEENRGKTNLGLTPDEQLAKETAALEKKKKLLEDALKEEKRLREEINKLKIDTAPNEETKLKLKAEIDAESFKKVEEDKRSFDAVIINIDKLRTEALRLNQKKLNQDLNDLYQKDFENAVKAGEAKADIDGADASKELAERLRIERETQERINGEREDAEVKGSIAQLKIKRDNLEANRDEELKNAGRTITNEQDLANKKYQINKKYADDINELDDEIKRHQKENLEKSVQTTIQFADIAMKYYQQQSDARIEALEKQGDAQTEAFDKEMEGLQNLRDKKLISESTFEARSAEIKEQRVASEKRVEAAIAAEKRKSAQVAKTLAAFKASLALLVAIAEENYIGAAIAAVELAAILATPIPAFKHGTKGKKTSGTALVGEEGAEFVHLPQGAQVVPHKQTVKNKELVNAMIDDKVDYYIFKNYTLPELLKSGTIERPLQVRSAMSDSFVKTEKNKTILKIQIADEITKNFIGEIAKTYHQIIIKQQSENERQQQKNFNSVIKNAITSTVINNGNGMDEYAMARAINSSGMRIKNVREIGKAIASEIVNVNDYRHL